MIELLQQQHNQLVQANCTLALEHTQNRLQREAIERRMQSVSEALHESAQRLAAAREQAVSEPTPAA